MLRVVFLIAIIQWHTEYCHYIYRNSAKRHTTKNHSAKSHSAIFTLLSGSLLIVVQVCVILQSVISVNVMAPNSSQRQTWKNEK
jgi:hypothetical protein